MTKVDLIAKVAAEAELTKKDAEKAVAAVLDGITEALDCQTGSFKQTEASSVGCGSPEKCRADRSKL